MDEDADPLLATLAEFICILLVRERGGSPVIVDALTVSWFLSNDVLLAIAAGVIGSSPWLPALAARREPAGTESPITLAGALALTAVFVLSIMHVAARSYNPFIYFRF